MNTYYFITYNAPAIFLPCQSQETAISFLTSYFGHAPTEKDGTLVLIKEIIHLK